MSPASNNKVTKLEGTYGCFVGKPPAQSKVGRNNCVSKIYICLKRHTNLVSFPGNFYPLRLFKT